MRSRTRSGVYSRGEFPKSNPGRRIILSSPPSSGAGCRVDRRDRARCGSATATTPGAPPPTLRPWWSWRGGRRTRRQPRRAGKGAVPPRGRSRAHPRESRSAPPPHARGRSRIGIHGVGHAPMNPRTAIIERAGRAPVDMGLARFSRRRAYRANGPAITEGGPAELYEISFSMATLFLFSSSSCVLPMRLTRGWVVHYSLPI